MSEQSGSASASSAPGETCEHPLFSRFLHPRLSAKAKAKGEDQTSGPSCAHCRARPTLSGRGRHDARPARPPAHKSVIKRGGQATGARMSKVQLAFIPSPTSNGLHLGPLFFHAYGLAYAVAVAAAIAITVRRWEAKGGKRDLVYEVAMWGFPAGVICGRLYFLATSWNEIPPQWWGPFAIWKGGLGIWGGIAAGTLAGLWVLRRRGANIPVFMDAAAPALLVAQAIGRIGNYFNQELFGGPTTLPWGLEISPAHRPIGYVQYATFHPTFLYELSWNLVMAGALVWLGRHRRIRAPGLFALYVAGYSFARIGEELLRVDPAHHIFGLRLNFYVASILCLAGIAWFIRIQWAGRKTSIGKIVRRGGALLAAGGLLALAGCGHSSRTDRADAQSHRAASSWSLLAGTDQRMLGRLQAF
jgi:prolipoprotein diacylglyceryl transferase